MKAHGEKLSVVDEVVDDLPVEMQGAGEITKRYQSWLVANAQPGDIVGFWLGLVFSEMFVVANPAWFLT
jgi:hypothetical protein